MKTKKSRAKFIILAVTIITIGILSCAKKEKEKEIIDTDLTVIRLEDLSERNMFFSDNSHRIDSCRFVPLETTDDCLVGEVERILISNDLIFIKDHNHKLFVFDENGKFLNTIGKIGQGPDEHLTLYDFYVNDSAKYVGIYDILRTEIYHYSFDGKMLKKNKCDPVINNSTYIQGLNNGKLIFSMTNDMENEFEYVLINEDNGSLYKKCLPYPARGTEHESLFKYRGTTAGKQFYATSFLSDTIYSYINGDLYPEIVFQSPIKKASQDIIDKKAPYKFGTDAYSYLSVNGYSHGLSEMFATDNYLCFSYNYDNHKKDYEIFWNLTTNKGYYTKYKYYENIFESMDMFNSLVTSTMTNNAFVKIIQAGRAISDQQLHALNDPRILKVMENIHEEDNPIVAFYYIKE